MNRAVYAAVVAVAVLAWMWGTEPVPGYRPERRLAPIGRR